MPKDLILYDLPAGQEVAYPGQQYPGRLCPEAQRLFFLCIDLVDRLVQIGELPEQLTMVNIVITRPYRQPKLHVVSFINNPADEHVTLIVDQLATIFLGLIRLLDPIVAIPTELHNLLSLMRSPRTEAPRTQPDLPLMKVHSVLMPVENRGALFVRLFWYTNDMLKVYDPIAYRLVTKELVFSKRWDSLAIHNKYLQGHFDRGRYDASAASVLIPQGEHFKYCQFPEDAGDPGLAHALSIYLVSEMHIASLQSALHLAGHLQAIKTETLFSWP